MRAANEMEKLQNTIVWDEDVGILQTRKHHDP